MMRHIVLYCKMNSSYCHYEDNDVIEIMRVNIYILSSSLNLLT